MKIVLISNYADSLIGFRGALLAKLARRGHEVIACAPGDNAALAGQLHGMGVAFRAMDLDRTGANPFRDIRYLGKLIAFFHTVRPDLVINYTVKPVIYGSLAARMAGVPKVYSVITGLGYLFTGTSLRQRFLRAVASAMYREALASNSALFFLNADDLAVFTSSGLVRRDMRVVMLPGEGIDLEQYAYAPPVLQPPEFLLIARLLRDKGIMEYHAAAEILKRRHPDASFRLLGPLDSNPTAIRKFQLDAWQEAGIIDYVGVTEDVRPALAKAGVYVLPSYREGLPRTILEAMAMGRPIVTTDVPGCRETVKDGDNGFLVPVGNAGALAAAMERFILDPGLIGKMGRRSREMAVEKYGVRKVNAVIMNTMGLNGEENL